MRGYRLVGYGFGGGDRRKKWTIRMRRGHNRGMGYTEMRKNMKTGRGADELVGGHKGLWNRVLEGDCAEVAKSWAEGTLDLVYLDPPFFTNRDHGPNGSAKAPSGLGDDMRFTDR